MNSICFIIPYFGKFPSFFNMWLFTASFNKDVNFLIFTDDRTEYNYSSNIKVIYMTFEELKDKIQSVYDFKIYLDRPYKLCDFRPAYGEIFQEYIRGYDFWGHCDIDLMWGGIRVFWTDEILDRYDKIGYLGHATIFRNSKAVSERYRLELDGKKIYKSIFSEDKNMFFDENGINRIYKHYNFSMYLFENMADISALHYNFFLNHHGDQEIGRRQVLFWRSGHIYIRYIDKSEIKHYEVMYVHFLQRDMKYNENCFGCTELCIVPDKVFPMRWKDLTVSEIEKNSKSRKVRYYKELIKKKKT